MPDLEEDAKTTQLEGRFFPEFSIEYPEEEDIFELWVKLEVANGTSLERCAGRWVFRSGEFTALE